MGSLYNPVTGGYDDTSSTYNPVTGGYDSSSDSSISGAGMDTSTIPSVLPNWELSGMDLPGQLNSFPGGMSANGAFPGGAADPSGMNSLYLHPSVNPTPTGGYMNTLAQIAAAAASGFSTYAKGSPSVATPRPLLPGSRIAARPGMLGGSSTNWLVIGIVVAVGIGAMAWLVKAA